MNRHLRSPAAACLFRLPIGALFALFPIIATARLPAASITGVSRPVGTLTATFPAGVTGFACPLIERELWSGTLSANSGTVLTLADTTARPGSLLDTTGRYYVEITSGALEGERFDVNVTATVASANATISLDLAAASASTLATLPVNALAGASAVVRAHVTLGRLASLFSPGLVGNNNYNLADTFRVHGATGFVTYYLRGDGRTWRTVGGTVDQSALVIPPDTSVLVSLRSGAKRWQQSGMVRGNVFRTNLREGVKAFATGFPVPLSFTAASCFTDVQQPAGQRWVGSDDPGAADRVQIFNPATGGYDAYYLRANGTAWRAVGGSTDVAAQSLLTPGALMFVQRHNPDAGYLILNPLTP